MTTILSSSSETSAVEAAAKAYRNIFIGYLAWLVVGGLITAFLTWWVWKSGNRLQDTIRSDADLKTAEARRDTEELRKQNLATEAKLEEERSTRLKIEADLAWRIIDSDVIANKMKAFTGITAAITSVQDPEALRLARTLEAALGKAHWGVVGPDSMIETGLFPDGVSIIAVPPPPSEKDRRSWNASHSLVEELKKENVEAALVTETGEYRPNIVTIRVGARSMKYLDPQARDLIEKTEKPNNKTSR